MLRVRVPGKRQEGIEAGAWPGPPETVESMWAGVGEGFGIAKAIRHQQKGTCQRRMMGHTEAGRMGMNGFVQPDGLLSREQQGRTFPARS